MSLRLDALRRGKNTDAPQRHSASKTTHADAVLASLGYPQQPRRSSVSGQAIALIATVAVLAGLAAWQGAVWLTSRARPTVTPPSARAVAPRPASGAAPAPSGSRGAQPQAPAGPPPRFIPAPELPPSSTAQSGEVARHPAAVPPPAAAPPVDVAHGAPSGSRGAQQSPVASREPEPVPAPIEPERPAPVTKSAPPKSTSPAPRMARAEPPPVARREEAAAASSVPPPRFIPAMAAQSAPSGASAAPESVPAEPAPTPRPPAAPPQSAVVNRGAPPAGATENDYFKLALYYQQTNDFENALVQYKKVLEKNEMNAEAHNNLGVLYQNKGLSDEAIREFKRAVSIDPKYSKGHNNLGVALLRSGQVDSAAAEFRWLLDTDSKNVDALVNLGLALRAGNRSIEAREYLLRALMIRNTHPAVHYNLALIYEEDDELVKAIEHYEKFLLYATAEHGAITKDVRAKVGNLRARLVDARGK